MRASKRARARGLFDFSRRRTGETRRRRRLVRIGAGRRGLDPNVNTRFDDTIRVYIICLFVCIASARSVSTVKDDRIDEKLERKPRFNVFKVRDYVEPPPRARFGSPCAVFHLWVDMRLITVKIIR